MEDSHKEAMAAGRRNRQVVQAYLTAIESAPKPRRGRKPNYDKLRERAAEIETLIPNAKAMDKVKLTQEAIDIEKRLAADGSDGESTVAELEAQFKTVVVDYSKSQGISRAAWLAGGVPKRVLDEVGITA